MGLQRPVRTISGQNTISSLCTGNTAPPPQCGIEVDKSSSWFEITKQFTYRAIFSPQTENNWFKNRAVGCRHSSSQPDCLLGGAKDLTLRSPLCCCTAKVS